MTCLALVATDLSFVVSHRLPLIAAAKESGWKCIVIGSTQAATFSSVDRACERLTTSGATVVPWQVSRRGMGLWGEFRSAWRLADIIRDLRPDIIHFIAQKPVVYGGLARLRCRHSMGVVNAVSGLGYAFIGRGIRHAVLRRMLLAGHTLAHAGQNVRAIFQNEDDRNALVSRGVIPVARARLVRGSGVDPQQWTPARQLPLAPVVTVACRMLYDKGIAEVIESARILRARGHAIDLRLVGGLDMGNPRAIPESQLRAWEDQHDAKWYGQIEDMATCWQQARIACLPSYGEGMPKALIEAASCGLPIITTDTPGCRDICHHEDNGLLVPVRDPKALADALERLLGDHGLCVRMGQRGRQRVIEEFSLQKVVQQHFDIYHELLALQRP